MKKGLGAMFKNKPIFKIALMTFIWIVLREEFTVFNLITGVAISTACAAYARKFLPLKRITNINPLRMFLYLVYLIGQIYVAGFHVIMVIIRGKARADIVSAPVELKNESLRVILMDSITLTPGTISLDLRDDAITVLALMDKDEVGDIDVKGGLEERLLKVQK